MLSSDSYAIARRNRHLHDALPEWTVIAVDMAVMLGCCCLSYQTVDHLHYHCSIHESLYWSYVSSGKALEEAVLEYLVVWNWKAG